MKHTSTNSPKSSLILYGFFCCLASFIGNAIATYYLLPIVVPTDDLRQKLLRVEGFIDDYTHSITEAVMLSQEALDTATNVVEATNSFKRDLERLTTKSISQQLTKTTVNIAELSGATRGAEKNHQS
jgi:hypothetical protein